MSRKKMDLNKLRNICCQLLLGGTCRYVAERLSCSPSTVIAYAARLSYANIDSIDKLNALSDDKLNDIIYKQGKALNSDRDRLSKHISDVIDPTHEKLIPDYKRLVNSFFDKRITIQNLYVDYLEDCSKNGKSCVSRPTFYRNINRIIKQQCGAKPVMIQEHPYGAELLIDYTGSKFKHTQLDGTVISYSICVLTWAASNYIYAEMIPRETCEYTCNVISRALCFFDCKPAVLVSDNAKSMVLKHTVGRDAVLNPSFAYFLQRCGINLDANNPYSPSSKSSVELSVRMIQERVLPRIIAAPTKTLGDYNRELITGINKYINSVGFRNNCSGTSRQELFKVYEKPAAAQLQHDLPLYIEHLPLLRVKSDYRVTIDGCKYSVPYTLIGDYVDVDICNSLIQIYHKGNLVATHVKAGQGKSDSLNKEHMPENHRAVHEKRLKYKTEQDLLAAAKPISATLAACCRMITERFGMNKKNFCIYLINLYLRHRYERDVFNEALNRMMTEPLNKWNSYLFNEILDEIREYRQHHFEAIEQQTTLSFVDESMAFLRGKKAFCKDEE